MAGCLRTAWARETGRDFGPELAQLAVAGPLLFNPENRDEHRILAPKPADALYFGHGDAARCVRAEPRAFDSGCGADLPDALLPVQLREPVDGKPGSGPAWWSWADLLAFRLGEEIPSTGTGGTGRTDRTGEAGRTARTGGNGGPPSSREEGRPHGAGHPDTGTADADAEQTLDERRFYKRLCENGWSPPPQGDRRTHVAIDPGTRAAAAGRLFQTEGLDLDAPAASAGPNPLPGRGAGRRRVDFGSWRVAARRWARAWRIWAGGVAWRPCNRSLKTSGRLRRRAGWTGSPRPAASP